MKQNQYMSTAEAVNCTVMWVLINCYLLWVSIWFSKAWDLEPFAPQASRINQVIVWRSKAFLCVPRVFSRSEKIAATLLKAPWPEKWHSSLPFPSLEMQFPGCISNIHSAVSGDVDARGRLFILDAGSDVFHPKIVVFDLLRGNRVTRTHLNGISGSSLSRLVIDPVAAFPLAYISDSDNERIIMFNLDEGVWWPVHLSTENSFPRNSIQIASDLAVSSKKDFLFMTSSTSDNIFLMNLRYWREGNGPPAVLCNNITLRRYNASLENLGTKLGKSFGLLADYKSGIHYYLRQYHATVRWDSRRPISAESHTVTLQSTDLLPKVTSFFQDYQRQVWVVVDSEHGINRTHQRHDGRLHCVKIQNFKMKVAGNDFLM